MSHKPMTECLNNLKNSILVQIVMDRFIAENFNYGFRRDVMCVESYSFIQFIFSNAIKLAYISHIFLSIFYLSTEC